MIIKKQLKNGKISVTSSYFQDCSMIKESLRDSKKDDYESWKWRKDKPRDFSELELKTAVETMKYAKYGCIEMREFMNTIHPNSFSNYKFNFGPCKDYESYDDLVCIKNELEAKDHLEKDEIKKLEKVTNEIKDIDNFVQVNLKKLTENI